MHGAVGEVAPLAGLLDVAGCAGTDDDRAGVVNSRARVCGLMTREHGTVFCCRRHTYAVRIGAGRVVVSPGGGPGEVDWALLESSAKAALNRRMDQTSAEISCYQKSR